MSDRHPDFAAWMLENPDRPAMSGSGLDPAPEGGIALALSGGGFKAAMFHLGSLTRLNEIGGLVVLDRISSVSGGSIAAALLAKVWPQLSFDARGVASNFESLYAEPLIEFCRTQSLDFRSVASGILRPGASAATVLASKYDKALLNGMRLADLPERGANHAPDFVFNATNVQLNSLVRFRRDGLKDYRLGHARIEETTSLATATAASSAFPPVLSPLKLNLAQAHWDYTDFTDPSYVQPLWLADGGIYDNMGLERVFKQHRTILVSNAGNPFPEAPRPHSDWYSQLRRTVSQIHRHSENSRRRWLTELAMRNERQLAAWRMSERVGRYGDPDLPRLPDREAWEAATAPVRLTRMKQTEANQLINHGYSLAHASMTRYWITDRPAAFDAPAQLPTPL